MGKHFKAIAAMSLNRVIGDGNTIPWHLPEDFKWFRTMTSGHVVVMGRKTFESLGRPLPHRITFVLTRHPARLRQAFPGMFGEAKVGKGATTVKEAFQFLLPKLGEPAKPDVRLLTDLGRINPANIPTDVFVCGGAQIYQQTLPLCSDLYLTLVKRQVAGDVFFPRFEDRFKEVAVMMENADFKILHYRNRGLGED